MIFTNRLVRSRSLFAIIQSGTIFANRLIFTMESDSDSISSSYDDDDDGLFVLQDTTIVITNHTIDSDSDSSESKKMGWVTKRERKKYSS